MLLKNNVNRKIKKKSWIFFLNKKNGNKYKKIHNKKFDKFKKTKDNTSKKNKMFVIGFEPMTPRFSVWCSTTELYKQFKKNTYITHNTLQNNLKGEKPNLFNYLKLINLLYSAAMYL